MSQISVPRSRLCTAIWARGLDLPQELREDPPLPTAPAMDEFVKLDTSLTDRIQESTGFDADFLTKEPIDLPDGNTFQNIDRQPKPDELHKLQIYVALATELHNVLRQKFNYPLPNLPNFAGKDPTQTAHKVRHLWKLEQPRIPNSIQLLESKGVNVFGLPHGSRTSFHTLINGTPCVFASLDIPPEWVRVAMIKHLGHMILFPDGHDEHKNAQKELADFVFEFLIPGDLLQDFVRESSSYREFVRVAEGFRVPVPLVVRRAFELGIIRHGKYMDLSDYSELSKSSLRFPYERSRVFDVITDMEGGIDSLAEETSIPRDIVGTLMLGSYPTAVFDTSIQQTYLRKPSSANLHIVK